MKRGMTFLLILSLLLVCFSGTVCATGEPDGIEAPHIDTIVPPDTIIDSVADLCSKPATRGELQDNLVFPGTCTEQCVYDVSHNAEISLGAYQTGKADQYYCILIYYGTDLTADPIYGDYAAFGTEPGFSTKLFYWDMVYVPAEGQYTLVSFTAELEDDLLYPIDGTASMTDIYVYIGGRPRWNSFLMDYETREPLDTVYLVYGQTTALAVGRSPMPSYGQSNTQLIGELISVEEAGGIFFVTPRNIGSGILTFRADGMTEIPVEICIQEGGHTYFESTMVRKPRENMPGYNLHICGACGVLTRETLPSYDAILEKFTDVGPYHWSYDYIKSAVYKGLFNGITEKTFGPEREMNRAMLVTVLWRQEGEPEAPKGSFADVPDSAWYAQAVNWAASEGLVNGVGKNRFDPTGAITREQLITILHRYAMWRSIDVSETGTIGSFPDREELSPWAEASMAWALKQKLISGVKSGEQIYLKPKGSATRAQVSTILVRFIDNLADPVAPVEYPDTTNAVASGSIYNYVDAMIYWAVYEDGLLQIGGGGSTKLIFSFNTPWLPYKDQIKRVEILNGITDIGNGFFEDYPNLESVSMADTVVTIGSEAFSNCPKLKDVQLSRHLYAIGGYCFFGCTALEEILLPEDLNAIEYNAFEGCTSLKEVDVPQSVLENMGSGVFKNCTSLERVSLPWAATYVQDLTFMGCTALKEVELPYGAVRIGEGVFAFCSSLEELSLPPFLGQIYLGTFTGCTSLKNLYFLNRGLTVSPHGHAYSVAYVDLPFGDPDITTVWGYVGSKVEAFAADYGYRFCNIEEIME